MKASEILGKAVIAIDTAEKVGTVEDININPDGRRIEAFWIRTQPEGVLRSVPVKDIHSLGRDAITIESSGIIQDRTPSVDRGTVQLSKLEGAKVVTRGGNMVGTVSGVEIDPSNFSITGYEVNTGGVSGFVGQRKKISADVHYGEDILMVPEEAEVAAQKEPERRQPQRKKKAA